MNRHLKRNNCVLDRMKTNYIKANSRVIKRTNILKCVNNPPYRGRGPTANQSGYVIKMWYTNMYTDVVHVRWANVYLPTMGQLTIGKCWPSLVPTRWHYVEPTCWPTLRPMSKNNVGPTPFNQQWVSVHVLLWTNVGPT